jgi:hypothetical protein
MSKTLFPIDSLLISSNSSCWIVVIPTGTIQVLELDIFNWVTFNLKFNNYLLVICIAIPGFGIRGYWIWLGGDIFYRFILLF